MNISASSDGIDYITISLRQYRSLVSEALCMQALESGGVDNWEWYGEAMSEFEDLIREWNENHPDVQI